ncbi:MAG TPA: shikimate kinase, partial [Hyphomicrobiales bacterium]|nr:shikimate kinase [Hyphomicrobiales bacterium]
IAENGISIWLKAPVDLLLNRVLRRDNRPLLKSGDPRTVLERLLAERAPFYAEADLVFESRDAPHDAIVEELLDLIAARLATGETTGPKKAVSAAEDEKS